VGGCGVAGRGFACGCSVALVGVGGTFSRGAAHSAVASVPTSERTERSSGEIDVGVAVRRASRRLRRASREVVAAGEVGSGAAGGSVVAGVVKIVDTGTVVVLAFLGGAADGLSGVEGGSQVACEGRPRLRGVCMWWSEEKKPRPKGSMFYST
jgi:hypothetical protein